MITVNHKNLNVQIKILTLISLVVILTACPAGQAIISDTDNNSNDSDGTNNDSNSNNDPNSTSNSNSQTPSTGTLTDTITTASGITWHFTEKVQVGQFITGDYYVVGPVTIDAITPKPLYDNEVPQSEIGNCERSMRSDQAYIRNGFMLNPPISAKAAYDSGVRNNYDPSLRMHLPVSMKPGDALVSTISMSISDIVDKMLGNSDGPTTTRDSLASGSNCNSSDYTPIRTAAILTCVDSMLPADTFRPAFVSVAVPTHFYQASNIKHTLIPQVTCPSSLPDADKFIRFVARPWTSMGFFPFDRPAENMPVYGRETARVVGISALMLMCGLPEAKQHALLYGLIQIGIDRFGMLEAGHTGWDAWGGHHSGYKFPIVLAGSLLGDDRMAAVSSTFSQAHFQEDEQTGYGTHWYTGYGPLFMGHSGVNTLTGDPLDHGSHDWGPYEHKHPSTWIDDNNTSEGYRRCCSSLSWVGEALAMRMMHNETNWGHDAWFAYVDRWMTENEDEQVAIIDDKTGTNYTNASWARQGQCWDKFVENMWALYRNNLP
ncbi:MAG: hypothetical protein JW841_16115 [Deltaproteobacteria bacterium]|nr:hypothetical protein [Deltaproteobacteria bacterium]